MYQQSWIRMVVVPLLVCGLLAACAPPPRTDGPQSAAAPSGGLQSSGPKHLVAAIMVEPPALFRPLIPGAYIIQTGDLADTILHVGLSALNHEGLLSPTVAEAVPALENGQWRMLPDGRMELVWKIRPGTEWHDGTRLTADDLVFTTRLAQEPSIPEFRTGVQGAYELVERVEAVDAQTVSVTWKKPFIKADRIFSAGLDGFALPLPRHLLERALTDNRESFLQIPYWTREYVGLGPYKLREWVAGSHLSLDANDRYVLGRPKIDELEVRFILDSNTLAANILAGAVHYTLGIALSLEQSLEIRDQWREGKLDVAPVPFWLTVYPQFVNPNPPIVGDVRFSKAMLQAIDRQAMADTIMAGLVPIAHSYVKPDDPESRDTERFVVRYDYDLRRAAQGLEELGYARGADGGFRDAAGQRLALEVRATTNPVIHTKTMFPVADYWQRFGIAVDPLVLPVQRATDFEYQSTFPGFYVVRQPSGPGYVERFHSSEAPLPETRFVGRNRARYMNPEFDALIERYMSTIPREPRMQVLGQVVHHISDQLNVLGLFYDVATTLISHRLVNVPAANPTWKRPPVGPEELTRLQSISQV